MDYEATKIEIKQTFKECPACQYSDGIRTEQGTLSRSAGFDVQRFGKYQAPQNLLVCENNHNQPNLAFMNPFMVPWR
ncbi:MAG: hypothetical protein ABFS43_19580 [Thermodesulfobacteriota bacterium]